MASIGPILYKYNDPSFPYKTYDYSVNDVKKVLDYVFLGEVDDVPVDTDRPRMGWTRPWHNVSETAYFIYKSGNPDPEKQFYCKWTLYGSSGETTIWSFQTFRNIIEQTPGEEDFVYYGAGRLSYDWFGGDSISYKGRYHGFLVHEDYFYKFHQSEARTSGYSAAFAGYITPDESFPTYSGIVSSFQATIDPSTIDRYRYGPSWYYARGILYDDKSGHFSDRNSFNVEGVVALDSLYPRRVKDGHKLSYTSENIMMYEMKLTHGSRILGRYPGAYIPVSLLYHSGSEMGNYHFFKMNDKNYMYFQNANCMDYGTSEQSDWGGPVVFEVGSYYD